MKTTASNITLIAALNNINKTQGYSLSFNRFEKIGKYYHFTITSPSKVPGSRKSTFGRNLACASWHAHGYLFDDIFKIEPEAIIYSCGQKITKDSGNWTDKNIGSSLSPCMFSDTSIL
jgi:hypothetical protein